MSTMERNAASTEPQENVAIVVTIADAEPFFKEWLLFHLHSGFRCFYIYCDDESIGRSHCPYEKLAGKLATHYHAVFHFYYRAGQQRRACQYHEFSSAYLATMESEVMTRQEVNVRHAIDRARVHGQQWLLHIDIDELFFLNGHTIQQYVSSLSARSIASVNLRNYEVIPDPNTDAGFSFIGEKLVKKNFFYRGSWLFNSEQKQYLTSISRVNQNFFNYYQNGKSLFRVDIELAIKNVHSIRDRNSRYFYQGDTDPLILHFSCASYNVFVEKYRRLGNFSDTWRDMPRAGQFLNALHLKARDALQNSHSAESQALKNFFVESLCHSEEEIAQMLKLDLVKKISIERPSLEPEDRQSCAS